MKKLIILVLILGSFSVQSQEDTEYKNQVIAFIKKSTSQDMLNNAIKQLGMGVAEDKKEAYNKEAQGTVDNFYGKLAEIYMKEFTKEEIAQLNKFYDTDLGKKLASKQGEMTQKSMVIGQNWGMELQQIAQKYKEPVKSEFTIKK